MLDLTETSVAAALQRAGGTIESLLADDVRLAHLEEIRALVAAQVAAGHSVHVVGEAGAPTAAPLLSAALAPAAGGPAEDHLPGDVLIALSAARPGPELQALCSGATALGMSVVAVTGPVAGAPLGDCVAVVHLDGDPAELARAQVLICLALWESARLPDTATPEPPRRIVLDDAYGVPLPR